MRTDIDASFTPAQIPEEDKVPTTEIDPVVRAGKLQVYLCGDIIRQALTISMVALPRGSTVKVVTTHGASSWAIAKRIEVALPDGTDKSYFLKVWRHTALLCCNIILTCFTQIYSSDLGKQMAEAEFEGTAAVHAALPKNASGTIAWVVDSQTSHTCNAKLFIL